MLEHSDVLFAESWVEDCLELNFRYVDYQPLALLSYSSYVCWRSVRRVEHYLRVRVSIIVSIHKRFQINCSIDLCYIKIAVSETLPLHENCDIQGGAIHITQQATKLETVEARM